eukprot:2054777-Rhodomonas_salina.2
MINLKLTLKPEITRLPAVAGGYEHTPFSTTMTGMAVLESITPASRRVSYVLCVCLWSDPRIMILTEPMLHPPERTPRLKRREAPTHDDLLRTASTRSHDEDAEMELPLPLDTILGESRPAFSETESKCMYFFFQVVPSLRTIRDFSVKLEHVRMLCLLKCLLDLPMIIMQRDNHGTCSLEASLLAKTAHDEDRKWICTRAVMKQR